MRTWQITIGKKTPAGREARQLYMWSLSVSQGEPGLRHHCVRPHSRRNATFVAGDRNDFFPMAMKPRWRSRAFKGSMMDGVTRRISALIVALLLLACAAPSAESAEQNSLLHRQWAAYWIEVPHEPPHGFGIYLFRKELVLNHVPASFVVHVSADNRYKLYVNGHLVSIGPARGDILHWRFETVNIAGYLENGRNVLAAIVWNDGLMRPLGQISYRTGFILQGNTPAENVVNTNRTWKCVRDEGYGLLRPKVIGYYAASPGESLDMSKNESGWKKIDYNDSSWNSASEISHGDPKGIFTFDSGWMLVPSPIPAMEMRTERLRKVREATGVVVPADFLSGRSPFTVPANSDVKVILDQTHLTDAYSTISFGGGKGAVISLKYAETLYSERDEGVSSQVRYYKGNRNDVAGKIFIGLEDRIVSDGARHQSFTSLWWRAYRYVQLEVKTGDEPLTIMDIYGTYTGYPFRLNARFASSDTSLEKILEVGWRTARLCAFETYMDCPYYEQLQYAGDTRIQALVSYFDSGDYRLARNAIDLLDDSRIASGITESRYPTSATQFIPPFSLWWIGMLHDYWMYTPDSEFVKSKLPGERQILSFFHRYQEKDGSLRNLPYWNFTDWVSGHGWNSGVPPVGENGNSSILDMQLLWAYELGAQMEGRLGMKAYAVLYHERARQLERTILNKYWDGVRREFADTPEKDSFSQHANALAILTGVVSGRKALLLGRKILSDTTLTEATIYFKYYVNRALVKAGLGDGYLNWLGVWKANLKDGLTTWAETSDLENTRSDCHAWGASPNVEFFRTVLGIDSYAPGFMKILVEPHLGTLTRASGEIPHAGGNISVSYLLNDKTVWEVRISLPENTSGFLIWKGRKYIVNEGINRFAFRTDVRKKGRRTGGPAKSGGSYGDL